MAVNKICLICEKEFSVPKSRETKAKYCSKECLGRANGIRVKNNGNEIRECGFCKKEFKAKKSSPKKFCSSSCGAKNKQEQIRVKSDFQYKNGYKVIIKKCEVCGEDFEIIDKGGYYKNRKYCSKKCRGEFSSKTQTKRIDKICVHCGITFKVIESRDKKAKFCSSSCRAKHLSPIINAKNKKGKNVNCDNCGKEFYKKMSDIKLNNYCSVKCMGNHYSESGMFSGENSGTWNGGKIHYRGDNWSLQRRRARERDNCTCQRCGIAEKEYGQELSVHHIIPFIMFNGDYLQANKIGNLVSVCEPCHRKIHSGDNHPSKFKESYKNSVDDIV